jgi:hypothetical protein
MTDEEYRKELERDPEFRKAIAVINKHLARGLKGPRRIWPFDFGLTVFIALMILVAVIGIALGRQ